MIKTICDEEDDNKIELKMLKGTIYLVSTWIDQGDIEGVISDDNEMVNLCNMDAEDWLFLIKDTGNARKTKT